MSKVFISYSAKDVKYANRLQTAFECMGIDSWYAPISIHPGNDFGESIGAALANTDLNDNLEEYFEKYSNSQILVVLLSKNYMMSSWCGKELKLAISKKQHIYILQIDNEPLTPQYQFLLVDIQRTPAYHLNQESINYICNEILPYQKQGSKSKQSKGSAINCNEIGIRTIAKGDPYYEEGKTLYTKLQDKSFYLSAPQGISDEEKRYAQEHGFSQNDCCFGESLEKILAKIPISDLREMIEESRKNVFSDFYTCSNGCYFNNKKYGIYNINPFGRSEDLEELPILSIEFYTTDYFTHRVMKDVCKRIYKQFPMFWEHQLNFSRIGDYRIFLTSLGINLLLLDTEHEIDKSALITSRSKNSSETNGKIKYSLSVIEGVSLSDYDTYTREVRLTTAVRRGLCEELGVLEEMLKGGAIYFYDLFVNFFNLEIGISCSAKLKEPLSIEGDIQKLKGRDDSLEVAGKYVIPTNGLYDFIIANKNEILPQAIYSIGSFLNSLGMNIFYSSNNQLINSEKYILGKKADQSLSGDTIYEGDNFIAIIDGVTPKGSKLWEGLPGDAFVSKLLAKRIESMDADISAENAIKLLNAEIRNCYGEADFEKIPPEERLAASILIYSHSRHELWCFGDCQYRINGILYNNVKEVDVLLSALRSFYITTELELGKTYDDIMAHDTGRDAIMPFLKRQLLLENKDCQFGYEVLNGSNIFIDRIKKHSLKTGDFVVMASDGYPMLCDTLQESEKLLQDALASDPLCIQKNRGTKCINKELNSYDDRSYFSFIVK